MRPFLPSFAESSSHPALSKGAVAVGLALGCWIALLVGLWALPWVVGGLLAALHLP